MSRLLTGLVIVATVVQINGWCEWNDYDCKEREERWLLQEEWRQQFSNCTDAEDVWCEKLHVDYGHFVIDQTRARGILRRSRELGLDPNLVGRFCGQAGMISCDTGYQREGARVFGCTRTGNWEPHPPICIPIPCGFGHSKDKCEKPDVHGSFDLDVPEHIMKYMQHHFGADPPIFCGENVTLTCDPGFEIQGSPTVQCTGHGSFHPQTPTCVGGPTEKPVTEEEPVTEESVTEPGRFEEEAKPQNGNAQKQKKLPGFSHGGNVAAIVLGSVGWLLLLVLLGVYVARRQHWFDETKSRATCTSRESETQIYTPQESDSISEV